MNNGGLLYPDLSGNGMGVVDLDDTSHVITSMAGLRLDSYLTPNDSSYEVVVKNNRAMKTLSDLATALGYIHLEGTPGDSYYMGGEANQFYSAVPYYTYYTWPNVEQYLFNFVELNRVTINGNGCKFINAPNGRYGSFSTVAPFGPRLPNTGGYLGPGIGTPYYAAFRIENCTYVKLENFEIDGNIPNSNVGSQFSDAGIQINHTGIALTNNHNLVIDRVNSHHHGQDGMSLNGGATNEAASREQILITNSDFEFNGRLGCAYVGGMGATFINCKLSHQGRLNRTTTTAGLVASAPCSGIDFEAEGGKINREVFIINCEFINNTNTQMVADSGTPTDRIKVYNSKLVSTGTGAYCLYLSRPGFYFEGCIIVGTCYIPNRGYGLGADPFRPDSAPTFRRCLFTDDVTFSPTGTIGQINNLIIEGGAAYLNFDKCTFIMTANAATGGAGNFDGPIATDCTFISRNGSAFNIGFRIRGTQSHFIEDGGSIAVPNSLNALIGHNNCGYAEDSWLHSATQAAIAAFGTGTGDVGTYTLDISNNDYFPAGTEFYVYRAGVSNTIITGSLAGFTLTVSARTSGALLDIDDKVLMTRRFPATIDKATQQPLGITNVGDQDYTYNCFTDRKIIRFTAALTVTRNLALSIINARTGMEMTVIRTGAGAGNLTVDGIGNIVAGASRRYVYDGIAWVGM